MGNYETPQNYVYNNNNSNNNSWIIDFGQVYENRKNYNKEYHDNDIKRIESFVSSFAKDKKKNTEFLLAWKKTCDRYINEIKGYNNDNRALEPLMNLSKEIENDKNLLDSLTKCINNLQKINIVAKKIDDAENEVLKRIKKDKVVRKSDDIAWKAEIQGQKLFNKETDWSLVFTKASNPVKIDVALDWLFDNPDIKYVIDYSNIDTSDSKWVWQRIKDNVIKYSWTTQCRLTYDSKEKTYVLRDKKGNPIKYRARIREWVKLIPDWVYQYNANDALRQAKEQQYENLWKTQKSEETSSLQKMLNMIPSAGRNLDQTEQKQLMEKTETRILYLLKMAKQLWYEIDLQEPISKVWLWNWHMELHLTDPVTFKKMSWTIRENANTENLWEKLYIFIDKNEWKYKSYITDVVRKKRSQLEWLTKHKKIDLSGSDCLTETEKQSLLSWMYKLKTTLETERNRSSNRLLTSLCSFLWDWIYSVENSSNISREKVTTKIIDRCRSMYEWYKWLSPTRSLDPSTNLTTENYGYTQAKNNFYKVFWWDDIWQMEAIRNVSAVSGMSPGWFSMDKTSSSHLENDIINNSFSKTENDDYNHKFQVKNEKINECVNKIYSYDFELDENLFDSTWNLTAEWKNKVKSIDLLYEKAAKCDANPNIHAKNSFVKYVVDLWLLPNYVSWWNTSHYNTEIVNAAIKLKNKLNSIKRQLDNFPTTAVELAEIDYKEKQRLEQKENKSEDDLKTLQYYTYLENNPSEQYRINQIKINMMKSEFKYWWFAQGLASCLFEPLAQLGWWATWYGAEIYNDMKWIGFRNLSDSNAAFLETMIQEIAITVVVAVATWWIWTVALAWLLRAGASVARAGKRVNLANKIAKIIEISWKTYKELSFAGKVVKWGFTASSLLVEWTAFNATSNVIHSAINWTSLDDLNLNPLAKENIQTAAFLWTLSCFGALSNAAAGWRTMLAIEPTKWLFESAAEGLTWLISETWKMLLAEQAINLVFWHDIVDPETWGVKKERFHLPTQQEIIQMIGMILAFKAVKPGIRQKYAQKLNDGTLEICRWVKKNQTLLRDPITWKVEDLQTLIDGNYNNYKKTAEQHKLNNYNKRLENQSKYNWEYTKAKEIISEIPENMRTESMKKFLETWDMNDFPVNDIKRIQREIWLTWKDIDWVLWPNTLWKLKDYILKKWLRINVDNWVSTNDKFRNKAIEELYDKFDSQIMSEQWITIEWTTYKLERKPNEWHNSNRKWKIVYTETWPDWKTRTTTVESDTFSIPENSNWKNIKNRFNVAREKYIRENIEASMQSVRWKAERELVSEIDSKSKDLEWIRKNRANLEWKKKTLSDEINWLKSRKAQLEQQLQNISKELIQQPDIVSLNDIYSIFFKWAWRKVSIWWKKCEFVGVKENKIIFTGWREFSSFIDLKKAWIKFDIDINVKQEKNRTEKTYRKQKEMFEELVWKESRTSSANETIKKYEELQRQKFQTEKDIKDGYFRENADRLVWKHIWIDGVERQCTHKNPKNGNLTFKKTDWHEYFSISSFEQLKSKWQVNWFWDRYTVQNKETRAAWRELSQYEKNNHELLRWENWVFKWEGKYIEGKKQELNQINNELSSSKPEYENAKSNNDPKKKVNPEYERIQKEIEWLDEQIKSKWKELTWIERDLWASATEIARLEQEISDLTAEKDALSMSSLNSRTTEVADNPRVTEKERFTESMWSDLHEEWRKGRKKEDWTYEPRIKETKDTEWISKNWTNQVDIANTKFEDLPSDWKYENLEAAKVAVDLVYDKISKWEKITPEILEEMSAKVHEERLKRNSWAKWWELDVSYDKLPEVEKVKDRNQVLQAIEKVWWKEKKVGIENLFSNYRKGLLEEPQQRLQEGKLSNEITNEIKNKVPDLLKIEKKSSINSEFSNNPKLHKNYIKTKVIKNLIHYTENIIKKWWNVDLIEVLKWSKEELSNIPYKQRMELINQINSYLESIKIADKFIAYESLWFSPKELFLRARWLDVNKIKDFEWDVKIERFRNSVVFVFEKTADVQKFFGWIWNWII